MGAVAAVLSSTLLVTVVCPPDVARGQATAEDLIRAAERAERDVELDLAEELYARVVQSAEGTREARRARLRLEWLRERFDPESGYGPLAALVRAQQDELGPGEAERFAVTVERMKPGRVRREALFLLGETWYRRLGRPDRAVPYYSELIESGPGEGALHDVAVVSLAEARAAAGQRGEALGELEQAGLAEAFEAREMRSAYLREQLRLGATGGLLGAVLVLLVTGRPWRAPRGAIGLALGFWRIFTFLYVVALPAAIAELYEGGTGGTFLSFGLAVLPVLVLAALSAESLAVRGAGRGARAVVLIASALAPIPIAYLVLEQAGALTSFGL